MCRPDARRILAERPAGRTCRNEEMCHYVSVCMYSAGLGSG